MVDMSEPFRFRLVGNEIIEDGGQVLAVLNEDCQPSLLDMFVLFLNDIAEAGASDEITEALFPDEQAIAEEELTTYQRLRDQLNDHVVAGVVPIPVALLYIRRALDTPGDEEDVPVIEFPEFEIEWTNDAAEENYQETSQIHGTIEHGSSDPASGVDGDTEAN